MENIHMARYSAFHTQGILPACRAFHKPPHWGDECWDSFQSSLPYCLTQWGERRRGPTVLLSLMSSMLEPINPERGWRSSPSSGLWTNKNNQMNVQFFNSSVPTMRWVVDSAWETFSVRKSWPQLFCPGFYQPRRNDCVTLQNSFICSYKILLENKLCQMTAEGIFLHPRS